MMWDSVDVAPFAPALRQQIHQANAPRIELAHQTLAAPTSGEGARTTARVILLLIGTLDTTSLSDSEFTALARGAAANVGRIDERLVANLGTRLARTDPKLANALVHRVDSAARAVTSWRKATYPTVGEFVDVMNTQVATENADMGALFALEGRPRQADSAFRKALLFNPRDQGAHYGLGQLAELRNDTSAARAEYMLAAMEETFPGSGHAAGHALVRLGVAPSVDEVMPVIRGQMRARIVADTARFVRMLPAFRLADPSGHVASSDQLKGKVVVVNVWGTWCGPCVGEAADIDTFYKKFKADSNVALVTVSYGDTPQAVRAFMASRRLTFPVLMDDGHWVDQKLHVPAYPTTYVVHRTGRIVYQPGTRTDLVDEWTWMVEAALKRPR
jgi:peroxiredoxin